MDSTTAASPSGVPAHGLGFLSALQAAEAVRTKKISSVELTRHVFERIERYNPALNAFTYQLKEEALVQARKADEAVARKEQLLGVFHGVPVHVKESFAVAGQLCTWGMPAFKDSRAPQNAAVVDRLLSAGAILIGATNVPVNLSDWQSHNPIYGTTNNPWDLKRTPGGSSGGTAAAVAAGLGYLSMGSDIGGSIRVPSHFCGIYGHKPTLDLVSLRGHQPGGIPTPPGFSTLLAVAGPMARSANDLLAALKVLGGPEGWDAKAWKWDLPPARGQRLSEFRVGYVLDDPMAPPAPDVRVVLEKALENLGRARENETWVADGVSALSVTEHLPLHAVRVLYQHVSSGSSTGAETAIRKDRGSRGNRSSRVVPALASGELAAIGISGALAGLLR